MRVFFLGNNYLACEILEWLKAQGEEIVGLVIHPSDRQRYGKKIKEIAGLPEESIFVGTSLQDPEVLKKIRSFEADIAISVLFGYIIKPPLLEAFPSGAINLHLGYLPYNRGAFPNVWCFLENTPAGATLHYMDPGIDTGAIIDQEKVSITATDTGESLYKKLEKVSFEIFIKNWEAIKKGRVVILPQSQSQSQAKGEGTFHRVVDADAIDHIDLNKSYKAGELIDLLRARTFPPYHGAYFIAPEGKKVYLQLQLKEEDPS
jgi:methionyl-tRNA formyltransferase